jgi:hypothetical protein
MIRICPMKLVISDKHGIVRSQSMGSDGFVDLRSSCIQQTMNFSVSRRSRFTSRNFSLRSFDLFCGVCFSFIGASAFRFSNLIKRSVCRNLFQLGFLLLGVISCSLLGLHFSSFCNQCIPSSKF